MIRFILFSSYVITGIHILFAQQTGLNSKQVIEKMLEAADKVKTITYTQRSWERFGNKTIYSEDIHKINVSPFKFYDYNLKPNKGIEVLYNSEKDKKNATVNPNGFPWTSLSLDPKGDLMHKDQHHSLFDAGLTFTVSVIKNAYAKSQALGFEKIFFQQKDTIYEGHACYFIKIIAPDYKYIDYTVKDNESMIDIAHKYFINEYQILSHNPSFSDYDDIDAGDVIKIPSAYAKLTYLLIDKVSFIPWVQIMHDEKGQFEKYEYSNLKLNPSFAASEFTSDFKDYNF
jgi:outer membrane lipoprotein-sorting protein